MSRRDGRRITVSRGDANTPIAFSLPGGERVQVLRVLSHWREWVGILDEEPERDIWRVETAKGICELHCLRYPTDEDPEPEEGDWLLAKWED